MPTLTDISRKTGLSVATVSNTLNGRPGYSQKTRQRVREAAEALGYTANPLARGLLGKSTKTIGIAWSLGRSNAGSLVQDLSLRLWKRGYVSFMTNALSDQGTTRAILADLLRRGVDGVILQASHGLLDDPEICGQLKRFRAAVAVVDEHREAPVDLVVQDTAHGVRQLMDYWLAAGRRRIGFMGNTLSNLEKIRPLREKLRESALPEAETVIESGQVLPLTRHFEQFWAALEHYFPGTGDSFPFDAVLCAGDIGAGALMCWLRQRGLRIPEDVAMAGVGDTECTRTMSPPLASLDRHVGELAETIEATLFRRLERPKDAAQVKTVPSTFVWRQSAGEAEPESVPQRPARRWEKDPRVKDNVNG